MYRFRRIKQYIAAQLSLHPTHRFSIHSVGRRHQGHDPFKYPDPSWLAFFATLVLPWPQPGLNLALPRIQNVFTLASSWNHAPGAITPSAMTFHLHHFFGWLRRCVVVVVIIVSIFVDVLIAVVVVFRRRVVLFSSLSFFSYAGNLGHE